MKQTKWDSLKETIINTLIGYSISVLTQVVVFPLLDVQATYSQNFKIGVCFTVVSITRSYLVRRYFNSK